MLEKTLSQKTKIPDENKIFLFLAGLFIIYAIFLPKSTDPSFLEWTQYIYLHGLTNIYDTRSNYLPVYHYFLWAFGKLEHDPAMIAAHIKYLRLFSLLVEFVAAYFFIWMVSLRRKDNYSLIYVLILVLNPAYFYNTLAFGQIDGMLTTFIFVSFCFAILEKPGLSLVFYVISLNCKFQAILFAPLLFLILLPVFLAGSWKKRILSLLSPLVMQFFIVLPFIIAGKLRSVVNVVRTGTVNFFPYLAPSANSFWRWFIPGNQGVNNQVFINGRMEDMLDTQLFMGMTYHNWGLLLFCIFSLLALYPLLKQVFTALFRRERFIPAEHLSGILLTSALLNLCFYFFNTQMHSRYSHYALIFIAAWSVINKEYLIFILFSGAEVLSQEHDLRSLKLGAFYDHFLLFNAYFITTLYFATIACLFFKLYNQTLN